MNLREDFKKFKELGFEALQKEIIEEKKTLKKKEYLFKVLHNLNLLDNAIKSGLFIKYKQKYISFEPKNNYDGGYSLTELTVLNNKKEQAQYYDQNGEYTKEVRLIMCLLGSAYFQLEKGLFNQEIIDKVFLFKLDENLASNLKCLLLNKELLTIVNYFELDESIIKEQDKQSKKIKI